MKPLNCSIIEAASTVALCISAVMALFGASRAEAAPSFVFPIVGTRVSSNFGARKHPVFHVLKHHAGIDLAAPDGAVVRTIASGRVVFADPYAGYGNLVVIEHSGTYTSHYGHLEKIVVKPGETVRAGQVIGSVGRTGVVSGPHLHLEIRRGGKPLDPRGVIPGLEDQAEG